MKENWKTQFFSDNTSGVCPEIFAALTAANDRNCLPFGQDEYTKRLDRLIESVFETNSTTLLVPTGTAANALCVAIGAQAYGAVFCHENSHIKIEECGAPEFYSGGAKLNGLNGASGKIDAARFIHRLKAISQLIPEAQPAMLSLTQVTEMGAVYTLEEIAELSSTAHRHGMLVHMDGARFANAVATLGCSASEASWRAGVDLLSFGGTKNGAMMAEAVVLFSDHARHLHARHLHARQKRGGLLLSKMRYAAAQFERYLEDGLWLSNASKANVSAQKLARILVTCPQLSLVEPVQSNLVFFKIPKSAASSLRSEGIEFYSWDCGDMEMVRLATSFDTTNEAIEQIQSAIKQACYKLMESRI